MRGSKYNPFDRSNDDENENPQPDFGTDHDWETFGNDDALLFDHDDLEPEMLKGWSRIGQSHREVFEREIAPARWMASLCRIKTLTPEQQASQDQELLAFERELLGPFHYVDRNSDPSKPARGSQWLTQGKNQKAKAMPKHGRKSRKKPVFWSPKKVD